MQRCLTRLCKLVVICCLPAGCDGADAKPRFFARSDWQAPLACPRVAELNGLSSVADVSNVSDSTFAVLLSDERRLVVFDAAFRQIRSITFDRDGPRGVLHPVSAVLTDSMLFVADDARASIRFFDRDVRDRGTLRLTFIPRRVRLTGARLVVTPLVAGSSPAHLVFEISNRKVVPLGGSIARYDEVSVNTLANMTSVAAFGDRLVVMHEMVVPFGYVMRGRVPASLATRFSVPVADDLQDRLGRLPGEPLTDQNVTQLAVVAFAAAPDVKTGSVYYVTRTGRRYGSGFQKLLVRLDTLLNAAAVIPIDVSPQHMIYLPARRSLVVVDSDSNWFECKTS